MDLEIFWKHYWMKLITRRGSLGYKGLGWMFNLHGIPSEHRFPKFWNETILFKKLWFQFSGSTENVVLFKAKPFFAFWQRPELKNMEVILEPELRLLCGSWQVYCWWVHWYSCLRKLLMVLNHSDLLQMKSLRVRKQIILVGAPLEHRLGGGGASCTKPISCWFLLSAFSITIITIITYKILVS